MALEVRALSGTQTYGELSSGIGAATGLENQVSI